MEGGGAGMKKSALPAILIVDDDPSFSQAVRETTGGTYPVNSVDSGERALSMLAAGFMPGIILFNNMASQKSGYETLEKIKQLPESRDIPVLFLSRPGNAGDEIKALERGAADYLTKPFVPEVLLARIKVHLKSSQEIRRLRQALGEGKKKAEPFPPFTPWERRIAHLARRRLTVWEMAQEMGITENTVKSALKSIYGKLDIHSKLQLADLDLED
jgi:DNA-binding NarL/FixJ family response regulator